MFIELLDLKVLRSSGAKCMVRHIRPPVHCAPLERQTVVSLEVYKHLAPSGARTSFRLGQHPLGFRLD